MMFAMRGIHVAIVAVACGAAQAQGSGSLEKAWLDLYRRTEAQPEKQRDAFRRAGAQKILQRWRGGRNAGTWG